MENAPSGILSRLTERVLGWIALGIVLALAVAVWQMGPDRREALWSGIWRTVLWLALVAAIPWGTQFFLRRIVAIPSNWAAIGLLAGLLMMDLVLALLLMTAWPTTAWGWLLGLGMLVLAATYNYFVTEYLAEMAGV